MKHSFKPSFAASTILVLSAFFTGILGVGEREQFQAQAVGEGQQMGQTFSVTITINEYSMPEDQKVLRDAFSTKGMDGLTNAVSKMSSKGRIGISGTVGYDANYIRVFQTPAGRKIRMVTNRPIRFGETWADSRPQNYSLSVVELDLDSNGKGTGILLPACELKMSKENEIEIEALQNPWRLTDVFTSQ